MKRRTISLYLLILSILLFTLIYLRFDLSRNNLSWQVGKIENQLGIKRSFNDVVIKYYKNNKFDDLIIEKYYSDNKFSVNRTKSIDKLNEVLEYLGGLELREDNDSDSAIYRKQERYELRFYNSDTNEKLAIELIDNEHVTIRFSFMDRHIDEDKNIIIPTGRYHMSGYKLNKNIDFAYFDELFPSLEEKLR